MFEHLDRDDHEDGSAERYVERICALAIQATFRLHDWTARKINHPKDAE